MHFHTIRANATKLSREHLLIQRKVNDYFLPKKNLSSTCKRPDYVSDNEIAAFDSIGEVLNSTP
jgi:hypothetical protein